MEEDQNLDNPDDEGEENKIPERPLECNECKRNVAVYYTEIVGDVITRTCMCADCPELKRRLHGAHIQDDGGKANDSNTGLACGNCGTTLQSLRVGIPLGCSVCYEVFDDILIDELLASEKVPTRVASSKKNSPVHIGRAPGESQEMNPTLRLLALNEALSETLEKEDYEQAALLRDQINALTDGKEQKKNPEKESKKDRKSPKQEGLS